MFYENQSFWRLLVGSENLRFKIPGQGISTDFWRVIFFFRGRYKWSCSCLVFGMRLLLLQVMEGLNRGSEGELAGLQPNQPFS